MFAARNLRRRIEDALSTASPLALADAMDAHICNRSTEDLHGMVERSRKRMDAAQRQQLDLYIQSDDADDLLGHRFSAFLRQNPRALVSLDADAVDAILFDLGSLPPVERAHRRLPAATVALILLIFAVAFLPLAAQYVHQRGLLNGLSDPLMPAAIAPFVETIAEHVPNMHRVHRAAPAVNHRATRRVTRRVARLRQYRRVALHHAYARNRRRYRPLAAGWKFDRSNNPYFNRARWHHPYLADRSLFGARARLTVHGYLDAVVAGNLRQALRHLGLPADGNTNAITELPIVTRGTSVAILGSTPQIDGREKVQADIVTRGREYFETFYVEQDGAATRIADRYYIPVNRRAEIAARLFDQGTH
jgi:hypothetical protein